MKLTLYSIPNNQESARIKEFLDKNNLPFSEIIIDSNEKLIEAKKAKQFDTINNSFLKINNPHSIHIINGYNESALFQLIKHINKYKPKIIK